MEINQQDGDWKATMTYAEIQEGDSPPDRAVAAVAQEYGVSRPQIRSRVVRYHDDAVTVVISRSDNQL